MNYTGEHNEETLSLKDLFLYILKKWRVLIIAMLVGAVLLGIYKTKFRPELIPLSTTEQQKIQDQIEENTDSISDYTTTIKENKSKVAENTDTIKASQAELEIQKDLVSDLEYIVSIYSKAGSVDNLATANVQLAAAKKKVASYETQIAGLEQENSELPKNNTSLQEKIYKLKEDNRDLKKSLSSQRSVKAGISSIIKYAILGAFLGAFIICGITFLQYLLYKKLRGEDELRSKYNVRVMGNLYMIPEKKNKNKIDKLINNWCNYNDVVDKEKQYRHIAAAIQVISPNKNKEILFTGTVDQTLIDQVRNKLQEILPQDGYPLHVVANPVYDADALLKIKDNIVILIEAKDVSYTREIYKLTDILHTGKAEVLGAVML